MKKILALETLTTEYEYDIREFRSCLLILQRAVENDNDDLELSDIKHFLEASMVKVDKLVENFIKISDIIFEEFI